MNGQKFVTTMTASKLEAARVARIDTDSYRSSIATTDMDAMSFINYDSDSLPPEMFNIIEEYSDIGLGK